MKHVTFSTMVVATLLLASPAAAEVRLTIDNGHVSLSATNATLKEILAQWAQVGQTKIVNAERVAGAPMTLELTNISEIDALEIILRSVSGYLLAPRAVPTPNASKYDRILIVPTSSAVRPSPPPPAFSPPPNPGAQVLPPNDDPDDVPQQRPPVPPIVNPTGRPPVFNTFPQPQPAMPPPPPPPPGAAPSPAAGVPVPGMVVPQQQQPGSPDPNNPR